MQIDFFLVHEKKLKNNIYIMFWFKTFENIVSVRKINNNEFNARKT